MADRTAPLPHGYTACARPASLFGGEAHQTSAPLSDARPSLCASGACLRLALLLSKVGSAPPMTAGTAVGVHGRGAGAHPTDHPAIVTFHGEHHASLRWALGREASKSQIDHSGHGAAFTSIFPSRMWHSARRQRNCMPCCSAASRYKTVGGLPHDAVSACRHGQCPWQ